MEAILKEDRHEGALLLLDWVAKQADDGSDPQLVTRNTNLVNQMSAAQIYFDILEKNAGGYYCAGHASFLTKVLRLYDFEAFTMNFGSLTDDLTHVVSILAEREDNDWNFYLLDASYGVSFVDNGELVDIFDLLSRHTQKLKIHYRQTDISTVDRLVPPNQVKSARCPILVECQTSVCVCNNPERNLQGAFSSPEQWGALLERNGYGTGIEAYFNLIMNRVFHIGDSKSSNVRTLFHEKLHAFGIPIGR